MSMRGEIISREYNKMRFVQDKDGKEYVCYARDLKNFMKGQALNHNEKKNCLDSSLVLGDSW